MTIFPHILGSTTSSPVFAGTVSAQEAAFNANIAMESMIMSSPAVAVRVVPAHIGKAHARQRWRCAEEMQPLVALMHGSTDAECDAGLPGVLNPCSSRAWRKGLLSGTEISASSTLVIYKP